MRTGYSAGLHRLMASSWMQLQLKSWARRCLQPSRWVQETVRLLFLPAITLNCVCYSLAIISGSWAGILIPCGTCVLVSGLSSKTLVTLMYHCVLTPGRGDIGCGESHRPAPGL